MSGSAAPPEARGRASVLVVDDDAQACLTLRALLEEEFEVSSAGSVDQARQCMAARSFDVVVTDFQFPGENGLGLLRTVTDQHPTTVRILLTGHGDLPTVKTAKERKLVTHVLLKPYDPKDLLRWVRTGVQVARLRQATHGISQKNR